MSDGRKRETIKPPRETLEIGPPGDVPSEDTVTQLRDQVFLPFPQRDRPTLTVIAGPEVGAVAPIGEEGVTVGRGEDATLRIDDPAISRAHLRVYAGDAHVWVEDLGSKNGTFIEGKRSTRPQRLADGQRIRLGPTTTLKYSLQDSLEQASAIQVYEWTVRDPLTGTYNRRYLDMQIRSEISFVTRHKAALSLLLIDIDHFKEVNDGYGHLAGDIVLTSLARFLTRAVRAEDVVARFGGEEFAILARGVPLSDAQILAERLRASIAALPVPWEERKLRITVSIGLAECTAQDSSEQVHAEELIARADEALYRAKEGGRNRVCSWEPGDVDGR